MAKAIEVRISGEKELQRVLNKLTAKTQQKVLKPAANEQAKVLQKEVRRKAPSRNRREKTGTFTRTGKARTRAVGLKRTIKRKFWSKGRAIGMVAYVVGADYRKGPHAHLVEEGHKKVLWGKRTSGRVPAYPFQAPAERAAMPAMRAAGQRKAQQEFARLKFNLPRKAKITII